jgi:hypothetical protein
LDDYRWLVSEAAQPWLARVDETPSAELAALVPRLRKELTAERAHLVVEQTELRRRAREKFSAAGQMFFTRQGLEQATDEVLAAYKAHRFPPGGAADLCCGIGGDLLALAARGPAVGVDLDPVAALLAEANARALGFSPGQFCAVVDNAASFEAITSFAAWHCDPDRRPDGRRTTRGELFEPPLPALDLLLGQNPEGAIKLAPATIAPPAWREAAELEWLGSRGECRQQVAWFGALTRHPGQQSATVVDAAGSARTLVGTADEPVPIAAALGRYLYEPHAAVLAAKLTATLCREHGLAAVAAGVAYLTGDTLQNERAMAAFEVLDVLPLDQKRLKTYCRAQGLGRLEVKKRGLQLDPEKLRKAVVGSGNNEATLIATPVGSANRVVVARRITVAH